ncbi:MAG: hypothetical protein E7273_13375 [Pseudobutyrivibrio ruminis]|nr:hypothetical protein [Pseudobutyrivibrio ruminis]
MATLFYATISSVNTGSGTANVTLQDRENAVVSAVPFLSTVYEMPNPGDTVAAIFEEVNGQIGKGVILGKIFLEGNTPSKTGANLFVKEFKDGESIIYDSSTKEMEYTGKKLIVDELVYKTLTQG